jgi:ribonuclease T1
MTGAVRSGCVFAVAFMWLVLALIPGPLYARSAGSHAGAAGLETIHKADLTPEAQETLRLLDRGGPFPFPRDGIVFGNREGILPAKPKGYYREYTVPTPGVGHRGARRIVSGQGGERYYTDDHYRSFRRIVE